MPLTNVGGMNNSRLLPLRFMAKRLRVPVRWLRGEAEAGRIPHLKADSHLLFDPEAVERTLLERARSMTQIDLKGGSS